MSFNTRAVGSSNFRARRPPNRSHRAPSASSATQEDAQPNELLYKRNIRGPPVVRSSIPASQPWKRTAHGGSSGPRCSPFRPQTFRKGATRSDSPNPGSGTPDADESSRLSAQHNPEHTLPGIRGISEVPHGHHNLPGRTTSILSRLESRTASQITQNPESSRGFPQFPSVDPEKKPQLQTGRPQPSAQQGTGFTVSSQGAPLMSSVPLSPSRDHRPPPRKRPRFAPNKTPQSTSAASENMMSEGLFAVNGQLAARGTGPSTSVRNTSLASASNMLLSDLGIPPVDDISPSSLIIPTHIPQPPRASSPSAAATSLPRPPSLHLAVNFSTQKTLSPSASSTAISSFSMPSVKRERSPTPVLDTGPRLVNEGCVRIAPLPRECMNRQPNYRAARDRLAKSEIKKLLQLGLQVTRVFTRDDGLVVDWKSAVPVMSNTLRPPPVPLANTLHVSGPAPERERPDTQRENSQQDVSSTIRPPPSRAATSLPIEHAASDIVVQTSASGFENHTPHQPDHVSPLLPATAITDIASHLGMRGLSGATPARKPLSEPVSGSWESRATRVEDHHGAPSNIIDLTGNINQEVSPSASTRPIQPKRRRRPQKSAAPAGKIPPGDSITGPTVQSPTLIPPRPVDVHVPLADASTRVSPTLQESVDAEDEIQAAAVDYLERYMTAFSRDRSALAHAYSRVATMSIQSHPRPMPSSHSTSASASNSSVLHPPKLHQGRTAIMFALFWLPDDQKVPSVPDEDGSELLTIGYDFLSIYSDDYGDGGGGGANPRDSDILLVSYAVAADERDSPADTSTAGKSKKEKKEKGKEKEKEKENNEGSNRRWACEHRFVLRRREWDGEDRSTPGLWPLVAVSHQMTLRELP